MQVAIELMWPGVPVTAWAIMLPRRSKTPAERSPDSRTTVVNEVRISAAACSLTTAIRRFQRTSRVIESMAIFAPLAVGAPGLESRRGAYGHEVRVRGLQRGDHSRFDW